MKNNRMKRTLSLLLAVLLTAVCIPVNTSGSEKDDVGNDRTCMSPLAAYFDKTNVNPDYIEWLKNGGVGMSPSAQDFSYLEESYARLRSMQNYVLLPEKYDLREYGLVEPVTDQGDTGLCWVIAANSAASGTLMEQFPQISFSPVHTAWFARRGNEEEEFIPVIDPYMSGGTDGIAVAAMSAWKGPVFSNKAPINANDTKELDEKLRWDADYHLQDAYYMPYGVYYDKEIDLTVDNEITKQLIMDVGAITINYYASNPDTYNEETSAYYNDEDYSADHAVLLVGWDDNYPKENFCEGNQPQSDGAWLVRNSWGTNWGNDGYFWLSYEDKSISSGNAYILEEKDNYEKNYQYDINGWSFSLGLSEDEMEAKTAKASNIFTAENDEMLEAVSFYTTDAGTKYLISVYTNVEEGKPESGTLMLDSQKGIEPYAGYHTIELDKAVKLEKGKKFSIVITLENPEYDAPIAIEWYFKKTTDDVPLYMGNGGESYIYHIDENGKWTWDDVVGLLDDEVYVTNVCIKGFTNPLPEDGEAVSTVRFSEMEGSVKDKTKLMMTTESGEEIYYSLDSNNVQKYTGALTLDFSMTEKHIISAYAVNENGKRGNTVTKEYTKAKAQLTDIAVDSSDGIIHMDTDILKHEIHVTNAAENVKIMAQSSDTIIVDGKELKSGDYTEPISLVPGESKEIEIEVKGDGKYNTTYIVNICRSILQFDYAAETVNFDDDIFTIKDTEDNVIKNGDSISHLISTKMETKLTVLRDGGLSGTDFFYEYIPKRLVLTDIAVDYLYEQTNANFSDTYTYSNNSNMSDKVQCEYGEFIHLIPEEDIYIQRQATDKDFASEIFHLEVPNRPAAPEITVENITETSVTLQEIEGAMYSNGGDWQESPEFSNLISGTEYVFCAYLPATETEFYSETGMVNVTTKIPEVVPSDYSFEVRYVDNEGNPVMGGGTVIFDKVGPYSREDIPILYGYIQIIPAHAGEEWLYPTALKFIDGAWTVTNPVVEIIVEKMATVNIIFKTSDGSILENLGYTEYFCEEDSGMHTATIPEGYEFSEDNNYALTVTRDADGKLIANPAEVVFMVKAIRTEEPSKPDESIQPNEPTKPQESSNQIDTKSPDMGDAGNLTLCLVLLSVSGIATVLIWYKKFLAQNKY